MVLRLRLGNDDTEKIHYTGYLTYRELMAKLLLNYLKLIKLIIALFILNKSCQVLKSTNKKTTDQYEAYIIILNQNGRQSKV